jgi:hypothetical protein
MTMMKFGFSRAFVLSAVLASASAVAAHHTTSGHSFAEAIEGRHRIDLAKAVTFHDDMRKLWEDHIVWTRAFIISVAHDLPDAGPTATRLLQNQVDIGDALEPFYGAANAQSVTDLLTEHILIAAELLTAAKAGDGDAVAAALEAWYENGDEIAAALSGLNPRNWDEDELAEMMVEHLDTTLAEALSRLGGNFAQDIADYEVVHLHILEMADFLSNGIIRQFPRKFR